MVESNAIRLTVLQILIHLRQQLLAAIEQDDKDQLFFLAKVFDMFWDVVHTNNVKGGLGRVLENLERSAYDYASGVGWKATIPSEKDIKAALGEGDLTS
jgi:hypothetical protein